MLKSLVGFFSPHRVCVSSLSFSLRCRCFSGLHRRDAAAAHITPPSRCRYDHRLPRRDPNEDAENAYFAPGCFQSGHRWVTCRNGCACFFTEACLETRLRGATCFGKLSNDDLADRNFCTVYFLFSGGCNQACFGALKVPDVFICDMPDQTLLSQKNLYK